MYATVPYLDCRRRDARHAPLSCLYQLPYFLALINILSSVTIRGQYAGVLASSGLLRETLPLSRAPGIVPDHQGGLLVSVSDTLAQRAAALTCDACLPKRAQSCAASGKRSDSSILGRQSLRKQSTSLYVVRLRLPRWTLS